MTALRYFYGAMIVSFVGVFVWTAFDIHNRLPILFMVQGVVLIVGAVCKVTRGAK